MLFLEAQNWKRFGLHYKSLHCKPVLKYFLIGIKSFNITFMKKPHDNPYTGPANASPGGDRITSRTKKKKMDQYLK